MQIVLLHVIDIWQCCIAVLSEMSCNKLSRGVSVLLRSVDVWQCFIAELSEMSCNKLSRGVTAIQRQRQREEQRRLKRERALQKRKKKTDTKSLYQLINGFYSLTVARVTFWFTLKG